jgi:hypothetical protein
MARRRGGAGGASHAGEDVWEAYCYSLETLTLLIGEERVPLPTSRRSAYAKSSGSWVIAPTSSSARIPEGRRA